MAQELIDVGEDIVSTLCFEEAGGAIWFATRSGRLNAYLLHHARLSAHGGGWPQVRAVLPAADGLALAVVTADGLHVIPRSGANFAQQPPHVAFPAPVVAAAVAPDGHAFVLDAAGTVHRVTLPAAAAEPFAAGPADAAHLAVDAAMGHLVVLVREGAVTTMHRFDLADGSPVNAPVALDVEAQALVPAVVPGLMLVAGASGDIIAYDQDGQPDGAALLTLPGATALARWHSLVMAAAGRLLSLAEWGEDVRKFDLVASFKPLVPGGWAPVGVDFAAAGFAPEDLQWQIAEGPFAATVSLARPADGDLRHEYRVIAGPQPTEFTLVGRHAAGGDTLVTRRFRIMPVWPDPELGPPMALTGTQRVYAKPGWGGGPTGPQNINIIKAPETWRVAAAVLRLKGTSAATNVGQRINQLKDDIVGGGISVQRYYEEVSYRATPASANPAHPKGTTIELLGSQVFGPIDVDSGWGDLFEPGNPDDEWSAWNPKGGAWDVLAGTFSTYLLDKGLADSITRKADSVLLMVLPGTDDPYPVGDKTLPAQWSWAFANDAQIYWKDAFSATFKRIPAVVMPAAQPANLPSPWGVTEYMSTIVHELGHNLGCPDLYNASGTIPAELLDRIMGGWDMMDTDVVIPHFSLAHRMRLGWIHPDWIEVCDFGANPASRPVTLQATESLSRSGPPAGRKAGVEIRIRDGWNYYFEYRREQAGQVGDQRLPAASALLGTDVTQAAADEMERPLIMLLPNDADGDGPVLRAANSDYEESDVTDPNRMHDFRITRRTVVPGDRNALQVDIEYLSAHRAELAITPAPGHGNFKSPDIDVDGPGGPNVAVKGKTNTIKLRVHNRGTKDANQVQVRVGWLPFTSAPGPWTALTPPPTQPIPAHATRDFQLNWELPASVQVNGVEAEHFCVRVDIDRYVDPLDPSGDEIVVFNNWAQSNFSTSAVGHGSPSERRTTAVNATNKLPVAAVHRTLVEQSDPNFRAFVDHSWRRLAPGETDVTRVDYESLAGDPLFDGRFQLAFRQAEGQGLHNSLTARSFVIPEQPARGPIPRWGVELAVTAGLRTAIRDFDARGRQAVGAIGYGSEPSPAHGGTVRVVFWTEEDPATQYIGDGVLEDGRFAVFIPLEVQRLRERTTVYAQAFYHGSGRYIACRSEVVKVR